jgi:hypothetical protein
VDFSEKKLITDEENILNHIKNYFDDIEKYGEEEEEDKYYKFIDIEKIKEYISNKISDYNKKILSTVKEQQERTLKKPLESLKSSTQPPPQDCMSEVHNPIICKNNEDFREQIEYFKIENNTKCKSDAEFKLKKLKKLCKKQTQINFTNNTDKKPLISTDELKKEEEKLDTEFINTDENNELIEEMTDISKYNKNFLKTEITIDNNNTSLQNIFVNIIDYINKEDIEDIYKNFWSKILLKFKIANDNYILEQNGGFKKKKYQTGGGSKQDVINDFVKNLQDNHITVKDNKLILTKPLEALQSTRIPPKPQYKPTIPELPPTSQTLQPLPSPPLPQSSSMPDSIPPQPKEEQSKPEKRKCDLLNKYLEKLGHEPTKEEYSLIKKEFNIEEKTAKLSIDQINKCIKNKYPDFIIPPLSKSKPMVPISFSNINIISSDTENTVKSNVSLGGNEIPYVSFPLMTINEFKKNPYYKPLIKH